MTITIQLPKKAAQILREMAAATGKSEDAIAFDALMEHIEDWYDLKIVDERMKNDDGVRIPLEDIVRELEAREAAGRDAAE